MARDPEDGVAHALRWRIEAGLARLLIAPLRVLPERLALSLGARGGRAALRFSRRYPEQARTNMRIAYPGWSDAQIDALLRASFAEMGRTVVEWARQPLLSPDELRAKVSFRGVDHLESALGRGLGVILVSAHYGHWELIPSALRNRLPHAEITASGRTLANPFVRAMVASRRNLGGGSLLERDPKEIIRALRRNAAVGILIDLRQSRKRGGILVPFLGRRAWTSRGPATIALRTGAALIPAFIRRCDDVHHRIEFLPEITLPRSADLRVDIVALTAALNDALASFIHADPAAWLWIHRRWRRSPDLPRNLYAREATRR